MGKAETDDTSSQSSSITPAGAVNNCTYNHGARSHKDVPWTVLFAVFTAFVGIGGIVSLSTANPQ